jgi:hypothetical protein
MAYESYGETEYEDEPRRGRVITPARVVLVLLLVAAAALGVYGGFFDRGPTQIPFVVTGSALAGFSLLMLAFIGGAAAWRAARDGAFLRALVGGVFGGLCAVGAAGALSAAVILILVWGGVG